jgi:hypothetical protein
MLKANSKIKILLIICTILLLIFISNNYIKPHYKYTVNNNEKALSEHLIKKLNKPVNILKVQEIENKLIVLFSVGSDIGESELTKGPNNKYLFDTAINSPNRIIYSIVDTNEGQFLSVAGMNDANISKIEFIIDEKFTINVSIPEEEYFITSTRLPQSTTSKFPTSSKWYDKNNKEISKINIL